MSNLIVLDDDEWEAMDALEVVMRKIRGWGLSANACEMTAAIHTLQSFVMQHMLSRLNPVWSDWYGGAAAKEELP